MLKGIFLFVFVCSITARANSQSVYTDSITKFQLTYKTNLYSIIKGDTAFVIFFSIDQSYRVIAAVEKVYGQSFFPMATSGNITKDAIKYAVLKFSLHQKEYTLFAYQLSSLMKSAEYKDDFFVPFTDSTSGSNSYGGGRYIDFVIGDISPDNKLVIDFNKSYNPYCAFRSGFNCPIPPKENDLRAEIKAGEMNFSKSNH